MMKGVILLLAGVAADTCSLFEIADGSCGQSDLDCAYTKYAKAAEPGLADGTCADQGYTVQTGTQTKTYPIIGDIVITTYSHGIGAEESCSLFEIADGSCGQSDLDCAYTKFAKAAEPGLADGTCVDQGYTVQTGTQTKTYPIIGDIVITTYSQGSPATNTLASVSGSYTGRVIGIIKITMDFDGDSTVNAFISVIGQEDISCPTEQYAEENGVITFTNIAADGDCFGEALRGQGKDVSQYTIDINADGTLTFHSDGYPNLKMTKDALAVAAVSGSYTGRVIGIIKITMDFDGDSTVNAFISVIGQEDISCPTEQYTEENGVITFTNIAADGDCFGEALRGQGKDVSQYTIDINADGTLTFHSDGYPNLKMTKDSLNKFFLA